MYINKDVTKEVAARQRLERAIVKRVVKDALAAGYVLTVDDGGEDYAVEHSTSYKAVIDALMNTDDDKLYLERLDPATGERISGGMVYFVYGNDGWDVINDYSLSIEGVLAGANALAEKLEGRTNR